MTIKIKPGSYVVAVSGGVDSVALLDLLSEMPDLKLTVAHFDHGMRQESAEDRRFARELSVNYGLPFVYQEGQLGPEASEAEARKARYEFLESVRQASNAQAIITAHHQDDLLETAILNMLRGTGRKGLTAMQSTGGIVRPLLKIPKQELLDYAISKGLEWREDPTNQDVKYRRNYVRHQIMPRLSDADRVKLIDRLASLETANKQIDAELAGLLDSKNNTIDRLWFNQLPHAVAKEMMAAWLRSNNLRDFDRKKLEQLVQAAKTARPGKQFPVLRTVNMAVHKDNLALTIAER